jgi:hypothetical protein
LSAWFLFSGYLNKNVDFSDFIFVKICEVISKQILIIFAPEEAEIFKDYLFILA